MSLLRSPFARVLCASIATLAGASAVWALHPKNAGPENFEIKFKLPPPDPLTPEQEMATFKVPAGYHVELVASDPVIQAPTALSWDDQGRMYVLEMRSYMHDVEGKGEDQPTGRVTILEDTKGDGHYTFKSVFADGLLQPRALMCVNGGAIVGAPPELWFMKDTKGTGTADVKETIDSHFGSREGQPEHMVNSPTWCMDNWIYCADHTLRYKLKDGKFLYERGVSRGQWGLSQDDFGRQYYNYNSDFLRATSVPEVLYGRNPDFPGQAGGNVQLIKDQSCWPSHPTPGVNRGYEKDQLREDGTLATCTATCGAGVYRAALFPKDFESNVFIPEPAGNLVKRLVVEEKDGELTAKNVYDKTEFFTSTDERCRPVNAYTGPDGALYIVDMYRGVIQHKGFLTHYLIGNILDRKLEEPYDRGRIWRVVPDGAALKTAKLPQASAELVGCLSDSNGWVRDTAQRLLVERKDVSVVPALTKLLASGPTITKLHALWSLEGIGGLTPDLVSSALHDADPKVRVAAIRVADRTLVPELAKMVNDPSPEVWSALGFALSPYPEAQAAVLQLAEAHGDLALVREPILSGLRGRELEVLQALIAQPSQAKDMIGALGRAVMAEHRSAHVEKLLEVAAAQPANSTAQQALINAAAGKGGPSSAKPKLIYLDSQPAILKNPPGGADGKTKPLLAALDARLAWPGKPGVPPPPVIVPLTPQQQKLYDGGKVVYETLCAACHQPTGTGMSGLAPALVDSNWVLGDPQILPRIVIYGLSGPLKVNNEAWSLEMPPLGAVLNDEQIAGVLTYIRREWEHNASPISVQQVAEIRAQNKDRTKAWSSEELEEILAAKHSAQR